MTTIQMVAEAKRAGRDAADALSRKELCEWDGVFVDADLDAEARAEIESRFGAGTVAQYTQYWELAFVTQAKARREDCL